MIAFLVSLKKPFFRELFTNTKLLILNFTYFTNLKLNKEIMWCVGHLIPYREKQAQFQVNLFKGWSVRN